MAKASWKGQLIAESNDVEVIEGYVYFARDSIHVEMLEDSDHHTHCPWKGEASYYHVVVDGDKIENGAWYYPNPSEEASMIKDRVAFWKGVVVEN